MSLMRTLLPAAAVAGVILALAVAPAGPEAAVPAAEAAVPATAAAPAPALPAITVSAAAPVLLRDRIIASGLVEAVEEVRVQPLVEGQRVEAVLAEIGDRVAEGEVLARLSTATLELQLSQLAASRAAAGAQIAQAEASLAQTTASAEEAERVAARAERLAAEGNVPRAQAEQATAGAVAARAAVRVAAQGIEAARAQLGVVDAQIANARLQLARTEVKAPVAGLVVARNAVVGAIASGAGPTMFTLVRDGAMELRAELAEPDRLRVLPGQRANLSSAGWPQPVAGKVRLVEPAIDPQTRLGFARITIDPAAPAVLGMFLAAEIVVAEEEQLAVAVTAVGSDGGRASVMRVREGVVERVAVTTGIREGGMIGIVAGLAAGDLVVTRAAAFVRDGDHIRPVPATAGPAAQAEEAP